MRLSTCAGTDRLVWDVLERLMRLFWASGGVLGRWDLGCLELKFVRFWGVVLLPEAAEKFGSSSGRG